MSLCEQCGYTHPHEGVHHHGKFPCRDAHHEVPCDTCGSPDHSGYDCEDW